MTKKDLKYILSSNIVLCNTRINKHVQEFEYNYDAIIDILEHFQNKLNDLSFKDFKEYIKDFNTWQYITKQCKKYYVFTYAQEQNTITTINKFKDLVINH